jgi:hypothetical protein
MQIDERDEQSKNTSSSINESREPDSNVTVERDSQPAKAISPRVSTAEGMQIDKSDEQSEKVPD